MYIYIYVYVCVFFKCMFFSLPLSLSRLHKLCVPGPQYEGADRRFCVLLSRLCCP